jgi:hypothetical protein
VNSPGRAGVMFSFLVSWSLLAAPSTSPATSARRGAARGVVRRAVAAGTSTSTSKKNWAPLSTPRLRRAPHDARRQATGAADAELRSGKLPLLTRLAICYRVELISRHPWPLASAISRVLLARLSLH